MACRELGLAARCEPDTGLSASSRVHRILSLGCSWSVAARLGARRAHTGRERHAICSSPASAPSRKPCWRLVCVRFRGARVSSHPHPRRQHGPRHVLMASSRLRPCRRALWLASSAPVADRSRRQHPGCRGGADQPNGLMVLSPLMPCPSAFKQALQRAIWGRSDTANPLAQLRSSLLHPPWRTLSGARNGAESGSARSPGTGGGDRCKLY